MRETLFTRNRLLSLLLAAALIAAITGSAVGRDAPGFTLESAKGGSVSLGRLIGEKPILLIFWATWCPYCNAAIPSINDTQRRMSDKVQILAVDFKENRRKVEKFIKEKNVEFTVLFDDNGDVARKYGIVGIPTYILIDRKGRIVYFDNVLPPDIEKRL